MYVEFGVQCQTGRSVSLYDGNIDWSKYFGNIAVLGLCKACPSKRGTEFGAPLFPAVKLCDFSDRWQCMSGEIWYTLDSGSVLLTEAEAR
jgi:hypothetical protein